VGHIFDTDKALVDLGDPSFDEFQSPECAKAGYLMAIKAAEETLDLNLGIQPKGKGSDEGPGCYILANIFESGTWTEPIDDFVLRHAEEFAGSRLRELTGYEGALPQLVTQLENAIAGVRKIIEREANEAAGFTATSPQ